MSNPPESDPHPTPEQPPVTPLASLSGQQHALYGALLDLDSRVRHTQSKTAKMYLGAVMVYRQAISDGNPDGMALAAHGLRELMEKLPRYLDVPVAQTAGMTDRVTTLTRKWRVMTGATATKRGRRLEQFHAEMEVFTAWFEGQHTSRTQRAGALIDKLDPRKAKLPNALRNSHATIWNSCHKYFEDLSHHRAVDHDEFEGYLDELERFLLDRLRPRTYEDQATLRNIITEGESNA